MRQYAGGPRQRSSGASGNLTRVWDVALVLESSTATFGPRDARARDAGEQAAAAMSYPRHARVPAPASKAGAGRRHPSPPRDPHPWKSTPRRRRCGRRHGGRRRDGGCAPTGKRKAAGAAFVKPHRVTPILASRPDYVCSARPHPVNVVAQAGQRRSGLNGALACVHAAISSAAHARRKIVRNAPQVDELGGEFDESVQIGEVRGQAE